MDLFSIVLIAIGLAMDVFSISTVTGFIHKKVNLLQASKMASIFGSFHILMPLIGWYVGSTIYRVVADYDHWVAFFLLVFVGGRMIYGNIKDKQIEYFKIFNDLTLLIFSLAVSINSLAVGLTFYLEKVDIFLPVLISGVTAAIFTLIGLFIGSRTGRLIGKKVEAVGGLVLIAVGLKIFFSHMLN